MSSPVNLSNALPTQPVQEPAARVGWGFILIYAVAYTGIWLALLTPIIVTIALRVRQLAPAQAPDNLALVLSSGAACAICAGPLFGYLSDRTRSRFGMRRPWMIAGMVMGSIALYGVATAASIGSLLLYWCAAQIAFNAALASTIALLADQIPANQRGTVAGILGVCMPIGQLIGTYLVQAVSSSIVLAFLLPAVLGTAGVCLLAAVLRDRRLHEAPRISQPSKRLQNVLAALRLDPRRYRNFWCAWVSRLLLAIGSAFLTTYQPLYLVENLGRSVEDVPLLVFRSMLLHSVLTVTISLASGYWSDRLQRRRVFVLTGALVYAIGLWAVAGATTYSMFLLGIGIAAIAHGLYFAVDLALVTEVLPDSERDAAKDLGILNIANALPQVIAPLVGALVLQAAHDDYATMYAIAGAIALSSALAILPMKRVR